MKKSIFIAVLGAATAAASYGQGLINFGNYHSSTQVNGISYAGGSPGGLAGLFAGPEITAYLLFGASTDTSVSQMTVVPGSATPLGFLAGSQIATAPGPVSSGAGQFGPTLVSVNGGVPGTFAFAIEATGTYQGHTYIGYSPIAIGATSASSLNPPANMPASLLDGSFTIATTVVPEPTTLALAGLGGLASLVALRRKQA